MESRVDSEEIVEIVEFRAKYHIHCLKAGPYHVDLVTGFDSCVFLHKKSCHGISYVKIHTIPTPVAKPRGV